MTHSLNAVTSVAVVCHLCCRKLPPSQRDTNHLVPRSNGEGQAALAGGLRLSGVVGLHHHEKPQHSSSAVQSPPLVWQLHHQDWAPNMLLPVNATPQPGY